MHTHIFRQSKFKDYEICEDCGSYHSIAQVDPKEIYEIKNYWGDGTGRSTLDQQISNMTCTDECGISKVDRIMQFVPMGGRVAMEIACAPGEILRRLLNYGYFEVIGIEPSEKYIEYICNHAKGAVVAKGYYPQIIRADMSNVYDVIIGSDVMEHIEDYDSFFRTTQRVLVSGGKAIFMSPIILNEDGLYRTRDFEHPDEHCWVHTQKFLEPYLKEMFSEVKFTRWIVGHEMIILTK
jgi:2-polyprenyl-3-methyl-5-hydroxy-6-metoxy-1,4-benzoquinol methylase